MNQQDYLNNGHGDISVKLKDPKTALKRKENHTKAMKKNSNALKHGRYSKLLTQHDKQHITEIDELNLHSHINVEATMFNLIKSNLKRIELQLKHEEEKQVFSESLTKLIKETYSMLKALTPKNDTRGAYITSHGDTHINYQVVQQMNETERLEALDWVKTKLRTLENSVQ